MRNRPKPPARGDARDAPRHGKSQRGPSKRAEPTRGKPARGKPAHGKPAHGKPAHGKPAHGKKDPRHEHVAKHKPHDARRGDRPVRRDDPNAKQREQADVARARSAVLEAKLKPAGDLLRAKDPLAVGEWLWTMREGSERDLIEELLLEDDLRPRGFLPALVVSRRTPKLENERLEVTFARQGFQVTKIARSSDLHALADDITAHLVEPLSAAGEYALQVFVPDSNDGNRLAQRAQALHDLLAVRLQKALTTSVRVPDIELRRERVPMAQVCMYGQDTAAVGVIASDVALARASGGRTRMRLSGAFPSRAARKVEEAFAWLGMSPGPGELCVDLGAAPGGWSWVLLERRARVIAVDPARMDEKLQSDKRLKHIQGDAFKFTPDEPVDWLFCDMVWRPIEVARMLGRWARQRNTRMLVSNFKLPMKRKVEMVQDIKSTLSEAGFTALRTRQLYHDRDEITLTARVR